MTTDKMRKLRVVVDTNIAISRLISPQGLAGRAFAHIFLSCTVVASAETIAELSVKLSHPKFAKYASERERSEILSLMCQKAEFIVVSSIATASPDPKDNMFLALAVDGRADYVVSGDKNHLLILKNYEGIPIVSPAEFLEIV